MDDCGWYHFGSYLFKGIESLPQTFFASQCLKALIFAKNEKLEKELSLCHKLNQFDFTELIV